MAVTSYYSVGGQILGESSGGTRTDYAADALGSVATTVDQTSAAVNQYAYKPYGSQLSKSGSGADPSFRWVGCFGYRHTGRSKSENYVRVRHYDQRAGRWSSSCPQKPKPKRYVYANDSPVTYAEMSAVSMFASLPRGWPAGWQTVWKGVNGGTESGDCGYASWKTFWGLIAPLYPDTSGYIIQHIRATRHCALCKGGDCPKPNESFYAEQYEAFEVEFTPSQNIFTATGGDFDDVWSIGGNESCSKGFVRIYSHMRYYPGLTSSDLKALGFRWNACPTARSMFCTFSKPAGWIDRPLTRFMDYLWNCCGHPPQCPRPCTKLYATFYYSPDYIHTP